MPITMHEEVRQDTVLQTMHVLLSKMLQKVPLRSTSVLSLGAFLEKSRMTPRGELGLGPCPCPCLILLVG